MNASSGSKPHGPLDGITVVEMGQLIAGPFCGQLLGDFGADVIKVESPDKGDALRQWGQPGYPMFWEILGRNKYSITANLRVEGGQALARQLIGKADILIENFRPGTLEKWGMSPEQLMKDNPRLIIVRVSGYGQTGPYSSRAGFGGIGEAMGGWRSIVGEPDRSPSRMGVSIGDSLAATFACLGALAALEARHKTGKGQIVDSSLYEAVLHVMESLVPDYAIADFIRERSGSILPGVAPSNVYPCKDGAFLIAANQDSVFTRLCDVMERPDLAKDDRYATHTARGKHQKMLDDIIAEWTKDHTVNALEAMMAEAGIPAGRMFRPADMLADPQFKARDSLIEIEHPKWGKLPMQNVFPKLSGTPGSIRSVAPLSPGVDNQKIYSERLGLSEADLASLKQDGII